MNIIEKIKSDKIVLIKRTADWLEKISVASMAVGIFQNKIFGIILGTATIIFCYYLTVVGGKK
ncbi:MAG: hypothetical protein EOL91_11645 [Actinobacteria bacterium]|nr:hypothetical protein [Actinomycetota bacterium]